MLQGLYDKRDDRQNLLGGSAGIVFEWFES